MRGDERATAHAAGSHIGPVKGHQITLIAGSLDRPDTRERKEERGKCPWVAETIHTSLSFLVFSPGDLNGYAGKRRGGRERFVKVGGKLMLAGETENNLYFGFFWRGLSQHIVSLRKEV